MNFRRFLQGCLVTLLSFALCLSWGNPAASAFDLGNSGGFLVPAEDEVGFPFSYPGPASSTCYCFETSGEWIGDPSTPETDACGNPDYPVPPQLLAYPQFTTFSLVADCLDGGGDAYEICFTPNIQFVKGERCRFKMNDIPGYYGDNRGYLFVEYQEYPCSEPAPCDFSKVSPCD